MDEKELKQKIEAQGYTVKSIRTFSKSFHVNYWSLTAKFRAFYNVALSSVEWDDLKIDFPKL